MRILRFYILIFLFLLMITKGYCQRDFFLDMSNNMSWRDSMECFMVINQLQNSDYAFVTQQDLIIYGKKPNRYRRISKQYDVLSVNIGLQTAAKYKIEKLIQYKQRRYEDSDTNSRRFVIKKTNFDFKEAVGFLRYVDSLQFHKLNNDSLTNKCGLPDLSGARSCLDITDIGDEIIYIKNSHGYHSVRSLYPEKYIEYFPENNNQRRIFLACRKRFMELMNEK